MSLICKALLVSGMQQTDSIIYVYTLSLLLSCYVGLFASLWTVACQVPLSIQFPRQEYWSGLVKGCSWPKDQTHVSCSTGRFFTSEPPGNPCMYFPTVFLYRLLHNIEYSSLCYTVGLSCLFHTESCVYINNKLLIYLSPFPFGNVKFVMSLRLICFVNKFLCIFYLEPMYKWYDVCLSLSDLPHLVWSSLGSSMLLKMELLHYFVAE